MSNHIVKIRKRKREITSRGEGWLGAYNRNSFCLFLDWDISGKASNIWGGGGLCAKTLKKMGLHALNYVRDFEQDTYYTTKLIQRANDYIQPIIFLHCRSRGSLLSLKIFVQHFFSSVLPNIRREYSLSQISIKIEVCSAFPARYLGIFS